MDLMPQSRVRNQNKIENADKTIDSDPQILTAHVKVLQPGAGEVYALELFRKTILKCRPNNDGVDIDIGIAQAVEIIQAQKAMMQNLPSKLANLPHLQTGLAQDLQTLYSGNVIWVRLSREPGKNMFACLVGLVILGNEKNNEKTLRINVHYPRQGIKDISIFDMPNGTVRLAEPIQLECIVNWNGGKFEKNDDQLCPEYMLNIMKNRGGDSGRAKTPWSGIWEVGAVTCRMIDAGVWNRLDIPCKNAFTYLELPFPLGYVPIGVSQMLMVSGRVPRVYAKSVLERTLQKFHDKSLLGEECEDDNEVEATVELEARDAGNGNIVGAGVVRVCDDRKDPCEHHAQADNAPMAILQQIQAKLTGEDDDAQAEDAPMQMLQQIQAQNISEDDDASGHYAAARNNNIAIKREDTAPWKGVELRVEQKDNNETNNQHNLSPIPEEYMSMVHQFNGIMRPISMQEQEDHRPCLLPVLVTNTVCHQMPGAQFSGTLPSSGLFSPMSHPFYPHPHAAYYHAAGMGQGWPCMPPQPVPCFYPPYRVHRPAYSSYASMPYACALPYASNATGLAPSQANYDDDNTPSTTAALTAASQCQPRNLDRVDLFMRRFCDIVLSDISCDPYRNDVDEDIGLVVSLCVYQGLTCEPGMAYNSEGDCEDEAQKFLQALLTVWKSVQRVLCYIEPNVCISAHMIRCTFYNESERKNIYHTLAALLCQDPNRSTCELRLVECTCSQIISDEQTDEFRKRINKKWASDHYQCIQWLDRYAVFEFRRGQLWHGARSYYPYAKQAVKIERDEDWAQLEEMRTWSKNKESEAVLVLMDFKQMLRHAGKREMMRVNGWEGVQNAEAWVQFVEAVEVVAEMAGKRYFNELTAQGEKFAAEFVRLKKRQSGG